MSGNDVKGDKVLHVRKFMITNPWASFHAVSKAVLTTELKNCAPEPCPLPVLVSEAHKAQLHSLFSVLSLAAWHSRW